MIKTFKCNDTESLWNGGFFRKIPYEIQTRAMAKLAMLNNAKTIKDFRMPPSNHLKALRGCREGQYSIRINNQYRICFKWIQGVVEDVEIIDYH